MSLDFGLEREEARVEPAPYSPPPPSEPESAPDMRKRRRRQIVRIIAAIIALPFVLTVVYAVVPPVSTLMLGRWLSLQPADRDWVSFGRINPSLARAVISSEDARFCSHWGVDWGALWLVIEEAGEDGPSRGASTITMQVAKNLFLWPGGGYLRKPFEIVLAQWIDLVWSKRRTMEVYLNIVEWGPNGIFGAEAIARKAFRKPAANLNAGESAILAAALPNPIARNSAKPTRLQIRRAAGISSRGADTSCLSR